MPLDKSGTTSCSTCSPRTGRPRRTHNARRRGMHTAPPRDRRSVVHCSTDRYTRCQPTPTTPRVKASCVTWEISPKNGLNETPKHAVVCPRHFILSTRNRVLGTSGKDTETQKSAGTTGRLPTVRRASPRKQSSTGFPATDATPWTQAAQPPANASRSDKHRTALHRPPQAPGRDSSSKQARPASETHNKPWSHPGSHTRIYQGSPRPSGPPVKQSALAKYSDTYFVASYRAAVIPISNR